MSKGLGSFKQVFKHGYPFVYPFRDAIAESLMLYPVPGSFDEQQFSGFSNAVEGQGEAEFYVGRVGGGEAREDHWPESPLSHISSTSVGDYIKYTRACASGGSLAHWSESGRWGLIIASEDFAIAGGSSKFVDDIRALFPPHPQLATNMPRIRTVDEQVEMLVSTMKSVGGATWLRPLLERVYGRLRAHDLLANG